MLFRSLALQQQAEGLRAELLELAAEISRWQERVKRAREAGAADLAQRAEAHLNGLMDQGRQRWQLLVALGDALSELEAGLRQEAAATGAAQGAGQGTRESGDAPGSQPTQTDDLDAAWARFEADQELDELRRRQRS